MNKFLFVVVVLLLAAAGLFLVTQLPATDNNDRPKIAASISPVADLVRNVAGDKYEVVQIIPTGSSPHTYEPVAADQRALVGSKIAFLIGQGLDEWAVEMLQSAAPDAKRVTLDRGIYLLTSTEPEEPGNDPHYWLSYSNAQVMLKTITSELSELDPANAEYYQANAESYTAQLSAARESALLKVAELENKGFVTFHSAFNYFAADLGLTVLGTIEPYPGQEPSAQYLAEVGSVIKANNIRTLFSEPGLADNVVSALANDYGTQIGTLDPDGVVKESYLEMMAYNVDTIVTALK